MRHGVTSLFQQGVGDSEGVVGDESGEDGSARERDVYFSLHGLTISTVIVNRVRPPSRGLWQVRQMQ